MEPAIYRRMRAVEDGHWWFTARRKIVQAVISTLKLPADAAILEAGCGTGGNLAMLSQFGRVTAVELDAQAACLAQWRGVAPVHQGQLPDPFPDLKTRFDLVVLLDVLEHIEEDEASLRVLRGLLKTNGRLVLTVPALPALWGSHDRVHHHKRRYMLRALETRLKAAGFCVDQLTYYNSLLLPLVATARAFEKLKRDPDADDLLKIPPTFINRLLHHVFALERRIIGRVRFPLGVSLLAVGRPA